MEGKKQKTPCGFHELENQNLKVEGLPDGLTSLPGILNLARRFPHLSSAHCWSSLPMAQAQECECQPFPPFEDGTDYHK